MNQKLLNGLLAGFVNKDTEALTAFKPNILSNNYLNNKKVLNEITFNLKNCDEFWFCSAFLRMSGYAVLANTLDEISQKRYDNQMKRLEEKILNSKSEEDDWGY